MHLRGERNRCRFSLFLSTLVPRFLSFFPPPPFPARSTFLSPREYNLARAYLWSRGEGGGGGWSCVWLDGYRENEGELPARKELNYQARRKVQPLKINPAS